MFPITETHISMFWLTEDVYTVIVWVWLYELYMWFGM